MYLGRHPTTAGYKKIFKYYATAGQTVYTDADVRSSILAVNPNNTDVFLNGILLDPSDYTNTGNSITLTAPALVTRIVAGYEIMIISSDMFAIANQEFVGTARLNGYQLLTINDLSTWSPTALNNTTIGLITPTAAQFTTLEITTGLTLGNNDPLNWKNLAGTARQNLVLSNDNNFYVSNQDGNIQLRTGSVLTTRVTVTDTGINATVIGATTRAHGSFDALVANSFTIPTTVTGSMDWARINNRSTTLAGYGITDAQAKSNDLTAIDALVGNSGFLKKTDADTWTLDTSTYLTGNQSISVSGDVVSTSGTTSLTLTLKDSGVTADTYKSVTVDAKGRVTAGTNPTTLAGYGITDSVTKVYSDTNDFINLPPKAGILGENQIPIYSSFPFGQSSWFSQSFLTIDKLGKQVLYFVAGNPVRDRKAYRAYRYTDTDSFIYDNDKLSGYFLNDNEEIALILNVGTNFMVMRLSNTGTPEVYTRTIIVKTGGSSDWKDWVFAYDVTAIAALWPRMSIGLVETSAGDRIIRNLVSSDNNSSVTLEVYSTDLTLLRSQELFNKTSFDLTDRGGQGRTSYLTPSLTDHMALDSAPSICWNKFTQTLHQRFNVNTFVQASNGIRSTVGAAIDISWSIPITWFETGVGTPTNLIPIKNGSFRYNILKDSTWNTDTGGMSDAYGGVSFITSHTVDEYSGDIYQVLKSTYTNNDAGLIRRFTYSNGYVYKTFSSNNSGQVNLTFTEYLPDASPWSKTINGVWLNFIGNNVFMHATSTRLGPRWVQTTFDTNTFASVERANDTLKLNSALAITSVGVPAGTPTEVGNNFWSGNFGTVVIAGTPKHFYAKPGLTVYTITASGVNRTYTSTGLTAPLVPSTIGGITGLVYQNIAGWNGSTTTPKYWFVVTSSANLVYMAICTSGVWSISGSICTTALNVGNTSRNDTLNSVSFTLSGQTLVTESGIFLFNLFVPVIQDAYNFCVKYNTVNNTETTIDTRPGNTSFIVTNGATVSYNEINFSCGLSSFGYTPQLGYYKTTMNFRRDAVCIMSSKDVTNVSAAHSEAQWLTGTSNFKTWVSTESSTGLVAYLSSFPIFLGGYYSTVTPQAVNLLPNATNYLYVSRNQADRSLIDVIVATTPQPESFSKVKIAKIVTNDLNIVSQETYSIENHDALEDLTNVNIVTKSVGDALTWNGTAWNTSTFAAVSHTHNYIPSIGAATNDTSISTPMISVFGATGSIVLNSRTSETTFTIFNHSNALVFYSNIYARDNMRLDIAGNLVVYADITAFSDARLKSNINTLTSALDTISRLRGVSFTKDGKSGVGVIAQEVQRVIPELVHESDDEMKTLSVAYGNMAGYFIEAIKELKAEIDSLKAEIKTLKL